MIEVALGIAMFVGGVILRSMAFLQLKSVGISYRQALLIRKPPRIASEGVYRYMKHPAYTGSLISIAGAGLACLGWGGVIIAFAALPLFQSRMVEEDALLEEVRNG